MHSRMLLGGLRRMHARLHAGGGEGGHEQGAPGRGVVIGQREVLLADLCSHIHTSYERTKVMNHRA